MEQLFPSGPGEIFLDNISLGDAEPEASSEATENCSFSTPSSRYNLQIYTDACITHTQHTQSCRKTFETELPFVFILQSPWDTTN